MYLCLARLFSISRSFTFGGLTDLTGRVYPIALQLLEGERETVARYPATKIGVSVTSVVKDAGARQVSVFDLLDDERESRLARAVDLLKEKYGERVLTRGSILEIKKRYHGVPRTEIGLG